MRWSVLAVLGVSVAAFAPEARACMLIPPQPLAGESAAAYRQRLEALEREEEAQRPAREAEWLRQRQADGLEHASIIFIARNTEPPQARSARRGPPVLRPYDWSTSYFTPVAWLRGRQASAPFVVHAGTNSCGGLDGVGDVTLNETGAEFIFFASGEPFTELTLIDAIAVDKITDPALVAFVARSRR